MRLSEKQVKFTGMLGKLLVFASDNEIPIKIVELYRSPEKQFNLYKKGKTKTLNSSHIKGLAVDLAIIKDGQYITEETAYVSLGEYWEEVGGVWGGSWHTFKDSVHFGFKG